MRLRVEACLHILRWAALALLVAGAGIAATPPARAPEDVVKVDALLRLVQERLDVAPQVAQTKWNTKAPIEDLPREEQIIERVRGKAGEFGLDPQWVSEFFQAQIDASKAIQANRHKAWAAEKHPPFEKVADLGKDIRPILDRLEPALLAALAKARPVLERPGAKALLDARAPDLVTVSGFDMHAGTRALAPLYAIAAQ
jgi:chorismate mutase